MSKVLVPIATGFEEIEAITIIDILRRADIEVVTAGLNRKCVLGAHGIEIKTGVHIDDVNSRDFDMIILPGGMPGSENLKNSKTVQALLGEMDQNGKYIGAICAAPIALAQAEVLKSSYTCYPSFEQKITQSTYTSSEDVVCDQNIITAKGPSTAMKFSLEIVDKLCGKEKMLEIKRQLLLC
ncbi:DJ-1 family glyoxalase III [Sulfurospirillum arcachonense]|uniref:DJ-1 family glyoxalase III n=1 Tax=Sulfurospirillum arcachonense TaxID=57666 RepID=UPI0004692671|nr:DJ-1 family glyoxalase III [Sulfurospirillum arcachonense]